MKVRSRLIFFTLVLTICFLVGGLILDHTQRIAASDQPTTDITLGVDKSQQIVINLYYDSQEKLNAVAGELDIWEVHQLPGIGPSSGYAVAAVVPSQKDWLETLGYRVELNVEKTAVLQAPMSPLDPRYYYYDDYYFNSNDRYMVDFMQQVNTTYPGLTELLDIGDAWQASHGGYHRDMWVLRISNEDPLYGTISSKPPFIMMANIHGREVTTPEMAIRYIKYLTEGYNGAGGYGVDPDVTWLVNHHVSYVLVSQNPDGHVVNESNWSAYWRKNLDNDDGCSSNFGVDLNRNSSFKWGCCGGSDSDPCGETYRGPARASEPETAAMQFFVTQVFQDWNGDNGDDQLPPAAPDNAIGIFLSLHSYQDEILWAYECAPGCGTPPNSAQLTTIGRKLADMTGEVMNPTGFLYTVDGGTIDYVYGKLGLPAYTFEIGPTFGTCGDFFPPYGCQDGIDGMPRNFWAEMSPAFLYMNKIAGKPYRTAYGPDTQNVQVSPSSVPLGAPVDLSATVIDQRYGSDPLVPISAAEYFIDTPGADGTGTAMTPSDGNWGGTSEAVSAVIDTTGLPGGRHYILVHALNQNGFWGPFTAVFLTIVPEYGMELVPSSASLQAAPGLDVTYHMQVNNIGQNGDTYDVSVDSAWAYTAPTVVGPVNSFESAAFDVVVTIPADAHNGESDTALVTITSQTDPSVSDSSTLISSASLYQPVLAPDTTQATGYPGGPVAYTLTLTNTGNAPDTFSVQSTSVWPVTHPDTIGPMEPGTSMDIDLVVNIPPSAVPGDSDTATIEVISQGDATKSATSTLTTTAIQPGPAVNPAIGQGSGNPGTKVSYTLQVINHNFVPDTFTLSVETVWGMEYPLTVGPIPPDGSANVTIKVTVPADAAAGAFDIATVSFTSSDPLLPPATATLTTTANTVYSFRAKPAMDPLIAFGRGSTVEFTVLITNTGNITDTYDIHASLGGWPVDVPSVAGPVARSASADVTVIVHVPLNIQIGDSNLTTLVITSRGNSLGRQVFLHTQTTWNTIFMPLSLRQ